MSAPTSSWLRVGPPTLDQPFGIHLWPIFEKAFQAVAGYLPQDFRFVRGYTPLSTWTATILILSSYYLLIFGGREFMRSRPAYSLNGLFKAHNFGLTAVSFILLVLFLEQLIPTLARRGVFFAVCDHKGGWTDQLVILYYVCIVL